MEISVWFSWAVDLYMFNLKILFVCCTWVMTEGVLMVLVMLWCNHYITIIWPESLNWSSPNLWLECILVITDSKWFNHKFQVVQYNLNDFLKVVLIKNYLFQADTNIDSVFKSQQWWQKEYSLDQCFPTLFLAAHQHFVSIIKHTWFNSSAH